MLMFLTLRKFQGCRLNFSETCSIKNSKSLNVLKRQSVSSINFEKMCSVHCLIAQMKNER